MQAERYGKDPGPLGEEKCRFDEALEMAEMAERQVSCVHEGGEMPPRATNMNLERMHEIVSIARFRNGVTMQVLIDELEVSMSTVKRDIYALRNRVSVVRSNSIETLRRKGSCRTTLY